MSTPSERSTSMTARMTGIWGMMRPFC
ncbi:hypothetical protein [Actinoplanes sp. ATCC 53533]